MDTWIAKSYYVIMEKLLLIVLAIAITSCSQVTNSSQATFLDPFVGYTWTMTGKAGTTTITETNPAQTVVTVTVALPASTWTFSSGGNLAVSSSAVSYSYALSPDATTVYVTASQNDSFLIPIPLLPDYPAGNFPFSYSYLGTYVVSIMASNHIHLTLGGEYDIDLTR